MTTRIVTDSTADIPEEIAAGLGIAVVPSYVVFGTETYRDGVDLTKQQFYGKLRSSRSMAKTAAPAPAVYEEVYRRLGATADAIVSVHLASRLSSIHNSAAIAAGSLPEQRIGVVDSEQVSMGYGWMAVAAAEAARRGESFERIVALVEGMKPRARVLAALDTLEFLRRGGRVGWVQAMIGTILQIKPLVEVSLGQVALLGRARTLKRALALLMERVQALGPLERAIILHSDARAAAEEIADRLHALHPHWQRLVGHAGVTIAAHAGPGAVGVACVAAGEE